MVRHPRKLTKSTQIVSHLKTFETKHRFLFSIVENNEQKEMILQIRQKLPLSPVCSNSEGKPLLPQEVSLSLKCSETIFN